MLEAFILTFFRMTIALVFALSASGKARNIRAFQEAVFDFRLLPPRWSKAAAWVFLFLEFATVLLIVVGGSFLLAGFALAAGLLMVFSLALLVALRRNPRIVCNCFGRTERRISSYDVARNALLLLCALGGVWVLTLNGESLQTLSGVSIVATGLMVACFTVLVTNLRDVVETLRKPFTSVG
jgi:uncharacterized membrane protein YphA (DoxX/SURF4 family)